MNDSTEEYSYKVGDIAWVKFGPIWWPGEVVDLTGPGLIGVKIVVKFFEEDSYEYVNKLDHIHPYNGPKKDHFILKGMRDFRAKGARMAKFPSDVSQAEIKTGGNPNLLSEPKYMPQKRVNYVAEIFGSPSAKKSKGSDFIRKKGRPSTSKSYNNGTPTHITHRRFIGYDDYQAVICIQYPGKDSSDQEDAEEARRINQEPDDIFNCHSCSFSTKRLEVMMLHNKSHIQGVYASTSKVSTKHTPDADKSTKRKKKTVAKKTPRPKKVNDKEEKPHVNIQNDILAEWEDSDDDDNNAEKSRRVLENSSSDDEESEKKNKEDDTRKSDAMDSALMDTQEGIKSCFDFTESEEDDEETASPAPTPKRSGRKMPRVVQLNKEKKTSAKKKDVAKTKKETDENKPERRVHTEEELDSAFNDLMENTAVPELPKVDDRLKPEQNFHDGRTVKFPDKGKEEKGDATKLINPKKRFVKTFEDFELEMRKKEESDKDNNETKTTEEKQVATTSRRSLRSKILESVKKDDNAEEKPQKSVEEKPKKEERKWSRRGSHPKKDKRITLQEKTEEEKTNESTEEPSGEKSNIPHQIKKSNQKNDDPKNKSAEDTEAEKTTDSKINSSEIDDTIDEDKSETLVEKFDEEPDAKSAEVTKEVNSTVPNDESLKIDQDMEPPTNEISPDEIQTPKERRVTQEKDILPDKTLEPNIININKDIEEESTEKQIPVTDENLTTEESKIQVEPDEPSKELTEENILNEMVLPPKKREGKLLSVEETVKDDTPVPPEDMSDHSKATFNCEEEMCNKDDLSTIENVGLQLPDDAICSKMYKGTSEENVLKEKRDDFESFLQELPKDTKKNDIVKPVEISQENNIEKIEQHDNTDVVSEEIVCSEEVHVEKFDVKCSEDSDKGEEVNFTIQTNLTNFSKAEELSALTLAALSEIKSDKVEKETEPEATKVVETPMPESIEEIPQIQIPENTETVHIEGNLTVVSEKDLADGQVEITSDKVIQPQKPLTATKLSLDFSEDTETKTPKLEKPILPVDVSTPIEKPNTYERLVELGVVQEKTAKTQKFKDSFNAYNKKDTVEGICDFEDCIPSQIVCALPKKGEEETTNVDLKSGRSSSKLLERLTDTKTKKSPKIQIQSNIKVTENVSKLLTTVSKATPQGKNVSRYIIKSTVPKTSTATPRGKPIIISEQIIKPSATATTKTDGKRTLDDIEDVEAFIIHRGTKKLLAEENTMAKKLKPGEKTIPVVSKPSGKAKILQQTIITPDGEIIQPQVASAQSDDNVFDINSMPIVLSDDLLTPESIDKIPIVLGSNNVAVAPNKDTKLVAVKKPNVVTTKQPPLKTAVTTALTKPAAVKINKPRILQTVAKQVVKPGTAPILPTTAKPGKYIIIPSNATGTVPQGKLLATTKPMLVKRTTAGTKVTGIGQPEAMGNKIMIVTNQQGQQQRLLLTPAQQKMLGYQTPPAKVTKAIVKGGVLPKTSVGEPGPSGLILPKSPAIVPQQKLTDTTKISRQVKGKPGVKPQKTILIKNQHGQTVRKIQGTDDEELDRQVAEQLEAIKASAKLSAQSRQPDILNFKQSTKAPVRRSYAKKIESLTKPIKTTTITQVTKPELSVPSLAPISPNKKYESDVPKPRVIVKPSETPKLVQKSAEPPKEILETVKSSTKAVNSTATIQKAVEGEKNTDQLQLVIQDAMGNQTTITEGQILALPSETTVDGQPQSYMLVTLDKSGNLTPLNNEALMSLDPSLGLGGDINNMVLQIDQEQVALTVPSSQEAKTTESSVPIVEPKLPQPEKEPVVIAHEEKSLVKENLLPTVQSVSEPPHTVPEAAPVGGQQLIVTGDPVATQKFLESLAEGTADLANILANAEGGSILIQADGQQILINTNSADNQTLAVNSGGLESTEGNGNPIFSTQPGKNQDILAAALADTDVFQSEQPAQSKLQSQLSPNSTLYPMNVSNVLETSLTLSSPIMTPLEVPSTNSKKIDDESEILNQVPKNVDLPITITDPNISQTVAQQQVANLTDLQTMELSLPISEASISVTSKEMSSPSYAYSLPTLDDTITHKTFNTSMPLLTDDVVEETTVETTKEDTKFDHTVVEDGSKHLDDFNIDIEPEDDDDDSEKKDKTMTIDGNFMEDEGLCTLGGEMCSSLSEPPPDMFDIPSGFIQTKNVHGNNEVQDSNGQGNDIEKDDELSSEMSSVQAETSSFTSDVSCEIPVQSPIRVKLSDLKRYYEEEDNSQSKRCKFD